ncbi:MAG: hypothetical protein ACXAEN_26305, partial [Candidatus Thorarchaeota archaeon]
MLKDTNEKNPTERPGWPYNEMPVKEEKMEVEVKVFHGLKQVCRLLNSECDQAQLQRHVRDFTLGREVKKVVVY